MQGSKDLTHIILQTNFLHKNPPSGLQKEEIIQQPGHPVLAKDDSHSSSRTSITESNVGGSDVKQLCIILHNYPIQVRY